MFSKARTSSRLGTLLVFAASMSAASPVFAQAKGRVSIGGGLTAIRPRDSGVHSTMYINPIVRLNPREGWGINGALNWFESGVDGDFVAIPRRIGNVRVRPLMAGPSYGWKTGAVWMSVSVVGGPAFNRLRLDSAVQGLLQVPDTQKWTVAVRPGFGITYGVAPRVGITGFAGYLINRPKFTVASPAGNIRNRWTTDAFVVSAGVVYSLF